MPRQSFLPVLIIMEVRFIVLIMTAISPEFTKISLQKGEFTLRHAKRTQYLTPFKCKGKEKDKRNSRLPFFRWPEDFFRSFFCHFLWSVAISSEATKIHVIWTKIFFWSLTFIYILLRKWVLNMTESTPLCQKFQHVVVCFVFSIYKYFIKTQNFS